MGTENFIKNTIKGPDFYMYAVERNFYIYEKNIQVKWYMYVEKVQIMYTVDVGHVVCYKSRIPQGTKVKVFNTYIHVCSYTRT